MSLENNVCLIYRGDLYPARIILSKAKYRADYLNLFLKDVSETLDPKCASFSCYFYSDLVSYVPLTIKKISGKDSSFAFIFPSVTNPRDYETLEGIIRTFVDLREKPIFREVNLKRGELDNTSFGLDSYGEYLVVEVDLTKTSFIPIEGVEKIDVEVSEQNKLVANSGIVRYKTDQWSDKTIDVEVFPKIMGFLRYRKLAKKIKKDLPEARILWHRSKIDYKIINEGYDWNMGEPIFLNSEMKAERERLNKKIMPIKKLIINYMKTTDKDCKINEESYGLKCSCKYAKDLITQGITDYELIAVASILKGTEDSLWASSFSPGSWPHQNQINTALVKAEKEELEKMIGFFSHDNSEAYMERLIGALKIIDYCPSSSIFKNNPSL